jgi:hypothetical protein
MSVDKPSLILGKISNAWNEKLDLPHTLLLDYDGEYMAEVRTQEYVNKATNHFADFYGGHLEKERDKRLFKKQMEQKVIDQIKCIINGKGMEQGLDVIGVWMSRDILFPQEVHAHLREPDPRVELVERYNYIHRRKKRA